MRALILGVLCGVSSLVATSAQAQLIVGNDQGGTATIWHVNITNGAATALYSSATSEAKPWGMAYDAVNNMLYWNNGSTLYKAAYSIGGITPQVVGTMAMNFVGLGFRNGQLVGTRNIATEAVYTIDPGTLAINQVYQYPSAFDFGGIDVDATNGALYGLSDSNGLGLYNIDTVLQTQTLLAPYPAGETDIDGLAVHNGLAYYVTDGPNTTQPNFYVYNVATGMQVGTLPSPFTGSGTFGAAAFIVPAPGGLLAFAMLGLTGMGRRRRA